MTINRKAVANMDFSTVITGRKLKIIIGLRSFIHHISDEGRRPPPSAQMRRKWPYEASSSRAFASSACEYALRILVELVAERD